MHKLKKFPKKFLGNIKVHHFVETVDNLMDKLYERNIVGTKVHFLLNYLNKFPTNLEALSDEQGEWFNQDIK